MPIRPCPECGEKTPRVLDMSATAHVNYYRCSACGHVWTTPKDDPDGPIKDVTIPPRKRGPMAD
jgi:uncharacterized Zn finger protein